MEPLVSSKREWLDFLVELKTVDPSNFLNENCWFDIKTKTTSLENMFAPIYECSRAIFVFGGLLGTPAAPCHLPLFFFTAAVPFSTSCSSKTCVCFGDETINDHCPIYYAKILGIIKYVTTDAHGFLPNFLIDVCRERS